MKLYKLMFLAAYIMILTMGAALAFCIDAMAATPGEPAQIPPSTGKGKIEELRQARAKGTQVLHVDFSQDNANLADWVLEGTGKIGVAGGALVVEALNKDATIWHKQELYGDVLIEFTAHINPPLAAGNLNVFVYATDPLSGKPVYQGQRSGAYAEYHTLPLYIFTFTGDQPDRSDATGWVRFRKDPGFSLLAENPNYKAITGRTYLVSILIEGGRFRYYLNEELVIDCTDPQPYRYGWFALRTWNTNLSIYKVQVRQLQEIDKDELIRLSQPIKQVEPAKSAPSAPSVPSATSAPLVTSVPSAQPVEPAAKLTNLVDNHDFSGGIDAATGLPVGWTLFGTNFTSVVDEKATVGTYSLKLTDNNADVGGGLRSRLVATEPGTPYRAEVDVLPLIGRGGVYLDFMDGSGKRVTAVQKTSKSNTGMWETVVLEGTAPKGAETVSIILYSYKPDIATVYFDNIRLYNLNQLTKLEETADAGAGTKAGTGADAGAGIGAGTGTANIISNREPKTSEIGYRPTENSIVETNPPSFVWLPELWAEHYILEYSLSPDFPADRTIKVSRLDYSMYMPTAPLQEGTWYWRYWGVAKNGRLFGPSVTRQFIVTEEVPKVAFPPPPEVRAAITNAHPRLFIAPGQLPELKKRLNPSFLPALFRNAYLAAITGVNLPKLQPTSQEVNTSLALLQELGVMFTLTGEERYAQAGRKLLLHMTKVEPMPENVPLGVGKDAIYMALITGMSRGYDWLYHALNEEERSVVLTYLRDLGTYTYDRLRTPPFESNPYSSHSGRIMGFLVELSIATMGEIPEAAKWFDYVLQIIYNIYPAWGGAAGGWSEGAHYWSSYMNFILDSIDAVELATGVKLYQKPFFRNTGYYKLYTHPPLTGVPFGDGLGTEVDNSSRAAMSRLAALTGNGHFTWYAVKTGGVVRRGGIVGLLVDRPLPPAKPPSDLPLARHFPDIGLVAMHTDLVNPENNISFQFRSSPYGSISHSHADQNSFVLYAYGDGLAISSGYYPWSQSPHHSAWTNQTLSKNTLLINGEGQATFNMDAKGRIENFIHTEAYDYTVGQAAQAYTTQVDSYRRHIVFIRPHIFIIVDDVRTPSPSSVDWLLHSSFPISWNEGSKCAHTAGKRGELNTYLIAPEIEWSAAISNQFIPPPELDSYAPQWHLKLSSSTKAERHIIAAVLIPNRIGAGTSNNINNRTSNSTSNGSDKISLLQADLTEESDNILTINLIYQKDGQEKKSQIKLDLSLEGAIKGPEINIF
ncbi:MAG TPA: DUF4962 domain-containing protein [Firmicutes bacterium]|nr:DUF4962 domain-containing protein [Bacillota bacterium]